MFSRFFSRPSAPAYPLRVQYVDGTGLVRVALARESNDGFGSLETDQGWILPASTATILP